MKIGFSMKDPNFLDHVVETLRERLEEEGSLDEDQIDEEVEKFKKKFRYSEYLDLVYDTETGTIEEN